ncbi:2610_t:CDS:2 [Diversispora eburnea]|uniref:2610_t:CDS:1 n=1 Tax=Diversispora eburnea TaxID=1213867 RepID=A0A9N9A3D5_9GLOM|nr:2610_t:CDS:2 [Diversispora eburnea]
MNSNTPDNFDPIAWKTQLDNTLGENKEQYWNHVQSFIQGKINRMELDFWANLFLPQGHEYLHEKFIQASINKNKKRISNNVSDKKNQNDIQKRTRVLMKDDDNSSTQYKALKDIFKSMDKEDRDQLHCFLKTILIREFPDYNEIYQRMTEIALNHELTGGIQEDCVSLMLHALEVHTKNIIHNCIKKVRNNNALKGDEENNNVSPPITLKDLAFSIEVSPYNFNFSSSLKEEIRIKSKNNDINLTE